MHSFDHIAIDDRVVVTDMVHVPLDVAIFSLSLMGSNFTDYVREAHRQEGYVQHPGKSPVPSRF